MKTVYHTGETVTLYMNLYQAGWFHRKGKPGTVDVHPGDFYVDRAKAVAEIDRPELCCGTVAFDYTVPAGHELVVNPEDSVAIPLSVTRRQHMLAEKAKGHDIMAEMAHAETATLMTRLATQEPAVA